MSSLADRFELIRGQGIATRYRNMNSLGRQRSVCPHDCPSVCALDVEVLNETTIGRVYGAKDHTYTQGVICAKVSRYAERVHHPDRLMTSSNVSHLSKTRAPASQASLSLLAGMKR